MSESNVENPVLRCLRCSSPMESGFLHIEQGGFPIKWIVEVPELNGPKGRNVYGWGEDAKRSSAQRRVIKASRRPVKAMRCMKCGMLELNAPDTVPAKTRLAAPLSLGAK